MSDRPLPADQQFFADLFSGLVRNPQQLGRVEFARQGRAIPGQQGAEWPRLQVVLRGEFHPAPGGIKALAQGEMLYIPARVVSAPVYNKPVMLLSILFAPGWLGLLLHDIRPGQPARPARKVQLPHPERGERDAMLMALHHLSASPQDQAIIQPLALSLLNWCHKAITAVHQPALSRGDYLYQSICDWVQNHYAETLSRDSVASFFNITPNHLSRLFSRQGTMSFVDYVRWVRMGKAKSLLQKYQLSVGEVGKRCGYADSDYFCRLFRRQFGLTPGEYRSRFQA
ncbi:helix-turn-helix transcriptional regulator [Pseudenterobacter timonensis]|uniref:Helix-turn-helix transcriptional regulator n=1 Tax=Pseudenterobacter timonensis TaxID=1755099 RepID=A0ABV4A6B3_9ENTR